MSSSLPTRTPAEIQAAFFEECSFGDLDQVNALLAAGADPKAVDENGNTPLHWASMNGRLPVVEALIAKWGEGPTVANKNGYTPLHFASEKGCLPVVLALLASGADPKAMNKFRATPLHWASMNAHLRVVLALLASGADPRKGKPLIEFPEGSSDFVLTRYAREMIGMNPELEKGLLSFQSALDAKTSRGAWAIAVVRGILFKHGASTESRVEEVPEGPAVGGAGGPGPGVS